MATTEPWATTVNLSATNVSNVSTTEQPYHFFQTEQVIFLSTLLAFITLANVCVLTTIMLSKNRKSRMNYFILHLALADLSTAVFAMLPDIIWKVTIAWYLGNIGCKLVRFFQSVATYASTYVLVVLSIDRFDAIARPMNFQSSGLRARMMVTAAWLFACMASSPMLFLAHQREVGGVNNCWIILNPWQWKLYVTLLALFVFILPAVVIACCYIFISFIIWSKNSLYMKPKPKHVTRFNSTKGSATPDLLLGGRKQGSVMGSSSRGILPKARVKTVKMTFVIVLVFIICWTPWFVYNLADVYQLIPDFDGKIGVNFFIQSLVFLNAMANPVIYCIFSSKLCADRRQNSCCDRVLQRCCFDATSTPAPRGTSEAPSTQSDYFPTTAVHHNHNHSNQNNNSRRMRSLICKNDAIIMTSQSNKARESIKMEKRPIERVDSET